MRFENSFEFAEQLDLEDSLREFQEKFHFPHRDGKKLIYFNGNSLGLQPKTVSDYISVELQDWAELGVHGHVVAKNPWVSYHKLFKQLLATIAGALPVEVAAMNSLTVNLHLLMVSFYRPTSKRYKIIIEKGAFSSDQYALETQIKFHGLNPDEALIELTPVTDDYILSNREILDAIEEHKDELALVLLGGVNFYTGQAFDIKSITEAGHNAGAVVGFDLAHAIGNIELNLHDWDVDFAVWCTYKYLNSGPGGVGGAFVHEKFAKSFSLPRFAGWWGYQEEERFKMEKGFKAMEGVDGWQLSNVPILSMAAHRASLDIFLEAGIKRLVDKSKLLTGYLEFLLHDLIERYPIFKIITPPNVSERGCQLSLYFKTDAEKVFGKLTDEGVAIDMRRPNVIRVTPVPLYNSFSEVFEFAKIFRKILEDLS